MPSTIKFLPLLLSAVLLPACSTGPNHIGNPLTWPVRGVIHGVNEASYQARRARLSNYVNANITQIHADIIAMGGATLTEAMQIADISPEKQPHVTAELASDPALYVQDDIEPIVVTLMVHSN